MTLLRESRLGRWLIAGLLIAVAIGLASCTGVQEDGTGPGPTGSAPSPPVILPNFNWEDPLPGSIAVSGIEEAQSLLSFAIIEPSLGEPAEILVTDPAAYGEEDQGLYFVYEDPSLGRFIVAEAVAKKSQAQLEAYVDLNGPPGASPHPDKSHFELVTIREAVTAVFMARNSPTSDHPAVLEWLDGGLEILVIGPENKFNQEVLISIANRV